MLERQLERVFLDFLKNEKGYPESSFLLEAPISSRLDDKNFRKYIADLLIVDTDYNNYLALIEFKASTSRQNTDIALQQVSNYLKHLNKPDLPGYLVNPFGENDFQIFILSDSEWKEIVKEDFPHYQTLQSKIQADKKNTGDRLDELKYKESKKKKEIITGTALSTLLSLIAGIATVLVFYFNTLKDQKRTDALAQTACCDSSNVLLNRLSFRMDSLEKLYSKSLPIDTTTLKANTTLKNNDFDQRLRSVEATFSNSPERLLKFQEISYEFRDLKNSIAKEKEINDVKFEGVKNELDRLMIWTSGLIITIIGSIIGFAINAFRKTNGG